MSLFRRQLFWLEIQNRKLSACALGRAGVSAIYICTFDPGTYSHGPCGCKFVGFFSYITTEVMNVGLLG